MNMAIITLLSITGIVFGGIGAFVITLIVRARRHAAFMKAAEPSNLEGGIPI
jgi:hypothetical protein